jgi:PTS system fructose-specific IIC component/PTS system nitrogen regulatory IIA component
MFLRDVFPPQLIKVNLEAEDKDEAFEEMVDYFCQATKSHAREEILKSLKLREAKMSTGIQKGIAIPHGTTNAADTVCGVLGISQDGIDYDALDGEPVYLLFMLIAPDKDSEKHLRVLQRLAELLGNPQFSQDLQTQRDQQAAYKIICKYEDMLFTAE